MLHLRAQAVGRAMEVEAPPVVWDMYNMVRVSRLSKRGTLKFRQMWYEGLGDDISR